MMKSYNGCCQNIYGQLSHTTRLRDTFPSLILPWSMESVGRSRKGPWEAASSTSLRSPGNVDLHCSSVRKREFSWSGVGLLGRPCVTGKADGYPPKMAASSRELGSRRAKKITTQTTAAKRYWLGRRWCLNHMAWTACDPAMDLTPSTREGRRNMTVVIIDGGCGF